MDCFEKVSTIPHQPVRRGRPPISLDQYKYVPGRHRTKLLPEQLDVLLVCFEHTPFPSNSQKEFLSEKLGLSLPTVRNWFKNQRTKRKITKQVLSEMSGQNQTDVNISDPFTQSQN